MDPPAKGEMVFATSKIIDRAPVVKFTFHGWRHRRKG